jgi:murein DD-endopeptidase MepM/ murein hydrolase activator NlpD
VAEEEQKNAQKNARANEEEAAPCGEPLEAAAATDSDRAGSREAALATTALPKPATVTTTSSRKGNARTAAAALFVACATVLLFVALRGRGAALPVTGDMPHASLAAPVGPSTRLPGAASLSLDPLAATDAGAEPGPPRKKAFRVASYRTDDTMQLVESTMGKRVFLAAMTKSGVHSNEAARILHAFEGIHSFERTQPKDSFFQARESEGRLVGQKVELDIQRRQISAAVVVGDDLKDSLTASGMEPDLMRRLDDALDGHISLLDIRKGGHLRIVATEMRVDGAFSRYELVGAVEYQSPRARSQRLRVYAFSEGKHSGHYNEKGERPFHGGFRFPIALARVTSRFNPRRMHPVLHKIMPHNGVDFAGSTGTPVYAIAAGTVKFAADSGPCGNMVQVAHHEGLTSAYCHLSRFANVKVNGKVEPGQLLGYVGQTGRVTGPHLHFAMKRNGQFIDPLTLKMGGIQVLDGDSREAFAGRKKDFDALLDAIVVRPMEAIEPEEPDAGESEFLDENLEDLAPPSPGN